MSAITGESVPIEVAPGAEVYAASINGGGALELEVTARTDESSLARIVRIVEQAQERKGRSQRLAERIARPLVPAVLIAAALIAILGSAFGDPSEWILRSLVVLVAAAPCAFAISYSSANACAASARRDPTATRSRPAVRRSFAKAWAIPPVARMPQRRPG